MSFSSMGKEKRINRLFEKGKTIVVPVDDSLIMGPQNGLHNLHDTIKRIVSAKPNALMGFKSAAEYALECDFEIPFIYNVTASTLLSRHTRKTLIASVENALIAGADGVAAHINFTSAYENEMLHNFAQIADECDRLGMPLLALAYPRSERNGEDYNYDDLIQKAPEEYTKLVAHCVRVASELGADIIKTQYTGTPESFQIVTSSSCSKPVVIAGGPNVSEAASMKRIFGAIKGGGAGISFGRNIFNSEHIEAYLNSVRKIIFCDYSWQDALSEFNNIIIGGKNG